MKQLFLLIQILVLSTNLFGERLPKWIRNEPRYDRITGGYEVVGSSAPMPDNGVERHLMAICFALENYAYTVDSVIDNEVASRTIGGKTEAVIEQNGSCSIDYVIKKIHIDKSGREHLLLLIIPGHHHFEFIKRGDGVFYENDLSDYVGKEDCYYSFSTFQCELFYSQEFDNQKTELSYLIKNDKSSIFVTTEIQLEKKSTKDYLREYLDNK